MKVVWVFSAVLVLCSLVAVRGEAKKYDSEIHDIKKNVDQQAQQSEAKAVSDLSNLQRLAALNAESKGTVNVGPLTITGPLGAGGLGQLLAALLGGGGGGVANPLNAIAAVFTGLFAVGAAIAAGFAALVGFIVPPLQIVNQILAIIALALLTAYIVEDKKSGGDYYAYEDYDTGYVLDSGYGYPESSGSGYSAPSSGGGGSSYTSYKRSDVDSNTLGRTARSNAYRPMISRVARMVNSAVKKYSKMYD